MKAIIGIKKGMTSIFTEDGKKVPCTVIKTGANVITQIKTEETDGYNSVQIAFGDKSEKNTPNALVGHFKKANTTPKRKVIEVRNFDFEKALGDEINLDIFVEGQKVNVTGTSKGKGFQGVVKRHGFRGVGMQTHGQHNRGRAPGSIGMASTPAKVLKGMRMAGRMGTDRVVVKNLKILKLMPEENLMIVTGCVPGHINSTVIIEA